MMKSVRLIRHAENAAKAGSPTPGHASIPLTERGIEQGRNVAEMTAEAPDMTLPALEKLQEGFCERSRIRDVRPQKFALAIHQQNPMAAPSQMMVPHFMGEGYLQSCSNSSSMSARISASGSSA